MSADNGYVVTKLYDSDLYGIFYYSGDNDHPPKYFTPENALTNNNSSKHVYANPVEAIVQAHMINMDAWTEYGVYVNSKVLADISGRDFEITRCKHIQ